MPITGSRVADEMMVLACQLATEKKSSIDGLYVIEVPLNLPLDARLVSEREKADRVMHAAAVIADQFNVKFNANVVTARQAGRAIVDEATSRRTEVILMGTMRKRRIADRAFGRTVRLRARPRALRGAAQPGAQGLPGGRLRRGRRYEQGRRFRQRPGRRRRAAAHHAARHGAARAARTPEPPMIPGAGPH